MAAKKKHPVSPASAPSAYEVRTFVHPDGRSYGLRVIDCRVYETWTNAGHGGGNNVSTRDSDEDAAAFSASKAAGLLKKGFVEGPVETVTGPDPAANVVEVLRSHLSHAGKPVDDFQPLRGRAHTWFFGNVSIDEWLVTNDDGTRAVWVKCTVFQSPLTPAARSTIASAVLDALSRHREAIFADEKTPVRKFPLDGAAPFTHLVVVSPAVANHVVGGRFTVSRSVLSAFPAYECEMSERDTVTVAEARRNGHGSLPYNSWHRTPHPVFDLAYVDREGQTPKFLVYPPSQLEARLVTGLAKQKEAEVHALNWRGEVRRFVRGQSAASVADLRAFFGLA